MEGAGVPAAQLQMPQLQPQVNGGKGHGKGLADLNSAGLRHANQQKNVSQNLSTCAIVWKASILIGGISSLGWLASW